MELLLNDLSLDDQFPSPDAFLLALGTVMRMRGCAQRYRRSIRVATSIGQRPAAQGRQFRDIVRDARDVNVRRSVLAWLEKDGPFLEDGPLSRPEDDVCHAGRAVAGSTLAEAACRKLLGDAVALAGFSPSSFDLDPLLLDVRDGASTSRVSLDNFWEHDVLDAFLRALEPPVGSWAELDLAVRRDFANLTFGDSCMCRDHPFNPGVAHRVWKLLDMLSRLRAAILPDGTYGDAWHHYWEEWVHGGELFSDSSDSEKREFDSELTFPLPGHPGERIKCPWHGKVNSPKRRVHFSFPIQHDEPTYVVYIGPKLTKR